LKNIMDSNWPAIPKQKQGFFKPGSCTFTSGPWKSILMGLLLSSGLQIQTVQDSDNNHKVDF
jgi:hypothetical protein